MNVCEINIGKAAVQKTVTVGGETKKKVGSFVKQCSSVNSDCVTVSFSCPLVSPVLAGMCRKKKQVKKPGRKSQKFNQPRLQTLITVIAIVNSLAIIAASVDKYNKDMEENIEDKDKAHCGAEWRQLLAFRWSDVTLHVCDTSMQ